MDTSSDKHWAISLLEGIPDMVRKNAIIAMGRGVTKVITATLDIPTAYLEAISDRKRAKTEAEKKMQSVFAKAAIEYAKSDSDLAKRAFDYYSSNIIQEQLNREDVTRNMLNELRDNPPEKGIDQLIDEDWLTTFWGIAQQKSSEEIQLLLGKILRNEICQPGAVSPHTLQLLSIITSPIAKGFQALCNLSFDDGDSAFVLHPNVFAFQNIGPLMDYGVSYPDLFRLDDVRLIRSAETLMLNYANNPKATHEAVNYAGVPAQLCLAGQQVHKIQFTQAGREIRNLLALQPNQLYTDSLRQKLGDAFLIG